MKHITMTDEDIAKIVTELKQRVCSVECTTTVEYNPVITFTDEAWHKAQALVNGCEYEIAWHGYSTYDRVNHTIHISDILVPPQTVTSTSVDTDATEYMQWLSTLSDDTFNHMHCHMHSHVNMNVFSSSTDDDYQRGMIRGGEQDYYLFLIFNKKGEIFARLYDVVENIMYDNNDIVVENPNVEYHNWAFEKINTMVKRPTAFDTQAAIARNINADWLTKKESKAKHKDKTKAKVKSEFSTTTPEDDEYFSYVGRFDMCGFNPYQE